MDDQRGITLRTVEEMSFEECKVFLIELLEQIEKQEQNIYGLRRCVQEKCKQIFGPPLSSTSTVISSLEKIAAQIGEYRKEIKQIDKQGKGHAGDEEDNSDTDESQEEQNGKESKGKVDEEGLPVWKPDLNGSHKETDEESEGRVDEDGDMSESDDSQEK